jgi:DNA-binding HxlR family transcriptional regulator/putative sterol carrier protein
MAKRSYGQFCPVARALDAVGERWTLLVVRELLFGQKRYTDLLNGLPGIGPQVLAARLKHLQGVGLVQKSILPPPAASTVYELTPLGRQLEPAMSGLASFGMNFVGDPSEDGDIRLAGFFAAAMAPGARQAARGITETYEFRVDDEVVHFRVDDGSVEVQGGAAVRPDLVVTCDLHTFLALASGKLSLADARAAGRIETDGNPEAARRSAAILGAAAAGPAGDT